MINAVIIQSPCSGRSDVGHIPTFCLPHTSIVGQVSSISEGIELVKSAKPNLVILDVDLPDGSGFQVFEETTEVAYEKIIVCEHAGYAVKAARYHVADYLLKPLRNEEIIGAVERLLFSQKQYAIQRRFEDEVGKRGQLRLERLLLPGFRNQSELVPVKDILRVTDEEVFRILHMTDGNGRVTPLSLKRIAHTLVLNRFFRIGDTLLNLQHVDEVLEGKDSLLLAMTDGFEIKVPLHLEQQVKQKLNLPGPDGRYGYY